MTENLNRSQSTKPRFGAARDGRPVLVVGPFPPPVTGFREITRALAARLEAGPGVGSVNTASKQKSAALRHLSQILRNLWAGWRILRAPSQGYGVISLGCNGSWGLLYTLFHAVLARSTGLNVTLHHHSYAYIDRHMRLMAWLCRIGGPRLTHVFLAPTMAAAFTGLYGAGLTTAVLPNAIFVSAGGEKPPVPTAEGRAITLGLLSNLDAAKGLHDFVATARLLHKGASASRVRMVLAGPIRDESDKHLVTTAQSEGVLTWLGPLYGADKRRFFDDLDIFLFATRYRHEAQPTVIYEALASGVAVIAYDRGAIADQVRDCLAAVPVTEAFAPAVLGELARLTDWGPAEWERLRDRARARHAGDIAQGQRTIEALFGGQADKAENDTPERST